MTKDYNPESTPANSIRRAQYACDDAWIKEFLSEADVGHLATHWEDQPFITPLLFWYDSEAHAIYLHAATAGRLHANSQQDPRACFEACRIGKLLPSNVALEFALQYESAIAFGDLRLVEDEAEKRRALYGHDREIFPGYVARGGIPSHYRARAQAHCGLRHDHLQLERQAQLA